MADDSSIGENKQKQKRCCISHEFLKAAAGNPSKIAVIHASSSSSGISGAHTPRKLINGSSSSSSFFSHHPPVYEGDCCYTYGEVLVSVDSLSARLRSILDGADDPYLIRHHTAGKKSNSERTDTFTSSSFSASNGEPTIVMNMYKPKIIGVYIPQSVEYIISVLSILRIGEAFLPLDTSWPEDRVLSIISSSNACLVIACGSSFGGRGCCPLDRSHWLIKCSICPVLCFSMEEKVKKTFDLSNFLWRCDNERKRSFCYLMYTSGSTGKPKGVCGTEQGLFNRFLWMQDTYPLHGEELLLFKTSISFVDHLQEFLSAILTACTLVIPSISELKKDLLSIINLLQDYSINRLTAVPSLMKAILLARQSKDNILFPASLKLLVLSGEVFPLSMWETLSKLLPEVLILNLYGSTEVSGDCTYFDCMRLPIILESQALTSVPIGLPISNCDVVLAESDTDAPHEGEICVRGVCVSQGYLSESTSLSSEYVKLHQNSNCICSEDSGSPMYFRTNDVARRLPSGDLVFLGRKDRTVKVNGQRVALEEVEYTLQEHPDIIDAAVISHSVQGELPLVDAFILLQHKGKSKEIFLSSIKSWMTKKLPSAMIPNHLVFVESLPMTSSGKVDHASLKCPTCFTMQSQDTTDETKALDFLQIIKKAFGNAFMVEEVLDNDNFFDMGGTSIAAAHVAHQLGINMTLIYNFPTPSKLQIALLDEVRSCNVDTAKITTWNLKLEAEKKDTDHTAYSSKVNLLMENSLLRTTSEKIENDDVIPKRLKVDFDKYVTLDLAGEEDGFPWNSSSAPLSCSFSRCNRVMYKSGYLGNGGGQVSWSADVPRNRNGSMQQLWKVHMESCVDASPLIVLKDLDIYLFIGSHSHKFLCVNAKRGSVLWEAKLDGRIECSAAITGDFAQVVVGCYKGKIYFLDYSNGKILWMFQTCGEVKCQPVVDEFRQLIWCGSHDHNLYALDYRNHRCAFKLSCGGSVFGSPAIDEVYGILYVASTSGRVTGLSVKASPFHTLWVHELEVPVFGSLSITSPNRYVICCLVDGHVVALDSSGCTMWRCKTGGPIFSGASTSYTLPSQVLVCCRDGSIYSFKQGLIQEGPDHIIFTSFDANTRMSACRYYTQAYSEDSGHLLWKHSVGNPITASAYVDENIQLISDSSVLADRLICVCSSSGIIHILRVNLDCVGNKNRSGDTVCEFSRLELQGDIFSSPVMIGGRVFVGCRDDYVHCIAVQTHKLLEE